MDYLERIWEPVFIHDSYACRKGKGIHKGVLRLQQFIRKVTKNGTVPACYLHLDIKNYFMSIDKDILYSLISSKVRDEDALWLSRVLIYHDCTENYQFKGDPKAFKNIPPLEGDVLLFQVGRFFEFYHTRDQEVARFLDLSKMQENRRGTRYGFPMNSHEPFDKLRAHKGG